MQYFSSVEMVNNSDGTTISPDISIHSAPLYHYDTDNEALSISLSADGPPVAVRSEDFHSIDHGSQKARELLETGYGRIISQEEAHKIGEFIASIEVEHLDPAWIAYY